LKVTQVPYDTEDPSTKEAAIRSPLWYNVFSTNDGIDKFTAAEVLYAFTSLVNMVDNPPPYQPVSRSFLPLVMRAP